MRLIKDKIIQKFWVYLVISLLMAINFGPFFNSIQITPKASANSSTTWTKSGSNPVINDTQAAYPRVIKDGDTYKMWVEKNGDSTVRYATSSDGVTWSALQNVKDDLDADLAVHEFSIIKDDSTYKMWYNGITYTGYRTSADGINWSAETQATYDVTKAWDGDRITPCVFKDGSTYKMYYNASEGNGKYYIAYATSSNGTSWTEPQNLGQVTDEASGTTNNNLVLKQGSSGAWDGYQSGESLYQMSVLKNADNTYEMWYGGNANGSTWKIGYATSADGIAWTKSGSNPVISDGGSGEWDDTGALYPTVTEDGSTYKMWYTNNWSGKIGYATAPEQSIAPQTASVTTPADGDYFRSIDVPSSFSGKAADGDGGTGLDANSTTFYIQRTSDSKYWTGTEWSATQTWLATTHSATADSSEVTWTSSATLPTLSAGTTYKSKAKATNKTSQTYTGTEVTYYYLASIWYMFHHDTRHTGQSEYNGPSSAQLKWSYSTEDYIYSSPSIALDGTIYIGSNDDNFYALNSDGSLKWFYATGDWVNSSAAIAPDGTIYFGSDDKKLYALNPDGTLNWSYTTGDYIKSDPSIAPDGTIYFGSDDNKLYALNPDGTLKWSYTTGGDVSSAPAIGEDGTVFVGSDDNKLYALNPDGTLKWSYTASDDVCSPSVAADGSIYFGAGDKLVALNPDGTLDWNYPLSYHVFSTPAIASDGTIYFGSLDQNFYALNPDGTLKWDYYTGGSIYSSPIIGADGVIYFGSDDNKLYALNSDGTKKWSYSTGNDVSSSPSIDSEGIIYFGSSDNKLYAIEQSNVTPQTASITAPSNNSYYRSANIPASFLGQAADGVGGTGLNANSTTFYIQRTSDNHYWDGTGWDATTVQWLATTHSATADSSSVTWTSSVTLPTWSSGLTYKSAAKATNKASQTLTGTEITYYYDSVSPITASVTTPSTGTYYKSSSIPATFSGSVADDSSGLGLAANSTTFYIQRTSDNYYWTGTEWSATQTWLSSTHDATTDGTSKTWSDNVTLPTWATGTTYKSAAKAQDRAGNTYTGTEITYYYDSVSPTTASVTTPTNGSTYDQSSIPATFSGSVSDNSNGFGLNADSTVFYIKRGSDNNYWTGTDWSATQTWLTTTHSATTSDTSATWQDSVSLPSWADGTYYSKVKATDKSGNTYEGSEINFVYSETGASVNFTMDEFYDVYNSTTWPDAISGTATGSNVDHVYLKIYRYTDGYYWDGDSWESTDPGWLSATGTTSWSYALTHNNFTNGVSYRVSAYAHDDNGDSTTNIGLFMYNSLNWSQYRINPIPGGNYFYTNSAIYPNVIKDGSTYKMWFDYNGQIHYATSTNGINWSYSSFNAVLSGTSGSWDSQGVYFPWVIKDGSTYKMWYSGTNSDTSTQKIGYATSTDGITWTKSGSNPIVNPGASGQWDDLSVMRPMVIKDGSTYKMWYNGTKEVNTHYEIGYATSDDGVTWTKYGSNPVIQHGSGSEWDYSNVWGMSVVKRGDGEYEMYYSGNAASGGTGHQIGYAYSASGVVWYKYGSNPVMGPGSSGSWNDKYVYAPTFMIDTSGETTYYRMWYNGQKSNDTVQIGYATMDAPTDTTKPESRPRFDLNETDPFSLLTDGSMHYANGSYWSGPDLWSESGSLRGDASDTWGMEKVQLTLQGSDGKYWDGDSWENETTWLNSATTNGYVDWTYTIDESNFTNNRTYTLQSKATDGSQAANVQVVYGNDSFKWDNEDPVSAITTTINSYLNSSGLPESISGTASDSVSGLQKIITLFVKLDDDTMYAWNHTTKAWVSIDSIEWEDLNDYLYALSGASPWSYTTQSELLTSIRNAGDGKTYMFAEMAIDNAFNSDEEAPDKTFTYDNTPPDSTPVFSRSYYSPNNWPGSVSGTASDATSGVASVSVRIKNDTDNKWWSGTDWEGTENSWSSASGTTSWSYNIAAGNFSNAKNYTVYSKATDNAANTQTEFDSVSFVYQTTGPSAPTVYDGTVVGQETGEVESLTTLSANWTAATDSISGIDHYEYAIGTTVDGDDIVSWTSVGNTTSVTKTGLSLSVDQTYYVSVKAINGAGVSGTHGSSSGQTVVDLTPPVVTIITYPSNPTNNSVPAFAGTSVDAMTNISSVEYKVDNGLWVTAGTNYGSLSANWSFIVSTLADGSHTVYVRSTDSKENTSNPVSYSFTVDTSVPNAPSITSPANGSTVTSSTPTITGTALANSTVLVTVYSSPKDYSVSADGNGNWSFTIPGSDCLENGSHRIVAKTRNTAGTTSAETEVGFTVSPVSTLPITGDINSVREQSAHRNANQLILVDLIIFIGLIASSLKLTKSNNR